MGRAGQCSPPPGEWPRGTACRGCRGGSSSRTWPPGRGSAIPGRQETRRGKCQASGMGVQAIRPSFHGQPDCRRRTESEGRDPDPSNKMQLRFSSCRAAHMRRSVVRLRWMPSIAPVVPESRDRHIRYWASPQLHKRPLARTVALCEQVLLQRLHAVRMLSRSAGSSSRRTIITSTRGGSPDQSGTAGEAMALPGAFTPVCAQSGAERQGTQMLLLSQRRDGCAVCGAGRAASSVRE